MTIPTATSTTLAPPRTMGQLYTVTDNHLTVHAGRVGRGVICGLTPKDPTIFTGRRPVSWHDDVTTVDCPKCIAALRETVDEDEVTHRLEVALDDLGMQVYDRSEEAAQT